MTMDRASLRERLLTIVKCFSDRRILVIGDSVADQFIYGAISRVSREAPVFILRHEHTETLPGGAANCAVNLASLGARVKLVSVVGDDESGRALVQKLKDAGVDCSSLIASPILRTTRKVRILAGQLHSTRQQVIRIDYEGESLNDTQLKAELHGSVRNQASQFEAIVISDYNYGVADQDTAGVVRESTKSKNIPVLVDSRFRLADFGGFSSATPNEDEIEQLIGRSIPGISQLEAAGEEFRSRLGYRALLITRGGRGMMLLEENKAPLHIDAVGAREPVDVTGAGDTVMATYGLALASSASFSDAAHLANYAGGIVVMKRGTAGVTQDELEHSILHAE